MYTAEIQLTPLSITQTLHDPLIPNTVLAKGSLTQVLNAIGDFQFELLPTHPLYHADIKPYVSLVRVRDSRNQFIFRGRVIDITRKMANSGQMSKTYVAECELSYLLDSMQDAEEHLNMTEEEFFMRLLSVHNAKVRVSDLDNDVANKRIDFFRLHGQSPPPAVPPSFTRRHFCKTGEHDYHINYGSTYENLREQVVNQSGGYIWLEYSQGEGRRILNYAHESGQLNKSLTIELTDNLESLTSDYQPSQHFTRLIPLGNELEEYELAIDRLRQVGLLVVPAQGYEHYPLTTTFWRDQVPHWRNGVRILPDDENRISPWTGKLLLGLSKLKIENQCHCEEDCQTSTTGCENSIGKRIEEITPDERLPDINSRWAYGVAIDRLANSGLIGSPEYWKDEERAGVVELRWLIRIAAMVISVTSPRRGSHNSRQDALDWLVNEARVLRNNDNSQDPGNGSGQPPIGQPGDGDDDDDDIIDPNEPGEDYNPDDPIIDDDDRDDELEAPPVEIDPDDLMTSLENEIEVEIDLGAEDIDFTLSPWLNQLIISLSRVNFHQGRLDNVEHYQSQVNETDRQGDNMALYEAAIDSLANADVIHSPNYWKQPTLRNHRPLRRFIRLVEVLIDKDNPIRMNPEEAINFLFRHRLITGDEQTFWREQIRGEDAEGENVRAFSPWIGEVLSGIAGMNFNRLVVDRPLLADLRAELRAVGTPDVNDEGAYYGAIDSLSNAGVIDSPEYWKEAPRRRRPEVRWLIRLCEMSIDPDDPISDFPHPRLTIAEAHPEGLNWLPIIHGEDVPIIEGTVVFETNSPVELLAKANKWIKANRYITNSISVSALDLSLIDETYDDFKIGDSYRISNPLLGIEENAAGFPLVEKKVDILNPMKSSLTFGDRKLSLSSSN